MLKCNYSHKVDIFDVVDETKKYLGSIIYNSEKIVDVKDESDGFVKNIASTAITIKHNQWYLSMDNCVSDSIYIYNQSDVEEKPIVYDNPPDTDDLFKNDGSNDNGKKN